MSATEPFTFDPQQYERLSTGGTRPRRCFCCDLDDCMALSRHIEDRTNRSTMVAYANSCARSRRATTRRWSYAARRSWPLFNARASA